MESFLIKDLKITPSLEDKIKSIHPAIGIVDDTAYVGVWVPCKIEDKTGEIKYENKLFLVTDKREMFLANDDVFREKGLNWRLEYKPVEFPNRWSLDSVQDYIKNGSKVDPKKLLSDMVNIWKKYIEFPDERAYLYHALWDIGTYFHRIFNAYAYSYLGGIKRTGKTKSLNVHENLAFNAVFSSDMSAAVIFRLIQNGRCTLLIDESEHLSYKGRLTDRGIIIRSLLLSGYKKGGRAYRAIKTRKELFKAQGFEVYSPKGLANIRGLEDVILDRCISTILKRGIKPEIINTDVVSADKEWSELRSELYKFWFTNWREIKEIYDKINIISELNESMNVPINTLTNEESSLLVGRELELWKPIIALAIFFKKTCLLTPSFIGSLSSLNMEKNEKTSELSKTSSLNGSLNSPVEAILKLAVTVAEQRQALNVTETGEVVLLQILRDLVTADNYYSVKIIKNRMLEAFDEEQKWLTTRWVGSALRRLNFQDSRRVGTGYQYKLTVEDVEDLVKRLHIPERKIEEETLGESPKKGKGEGLSAYIEDHLPSKPTTLAEKLHVILGILTAMEKETGMVKREKLFGRLETQYNILPGEADKLINQLLKDGAIFSPREGCLKRT